MPTPANLPSQVAQAYQAVIQYVKQRSRTFRLAVHFLPAEKQLAAWVIYAFFRRVDDMVDEEKVSLDDFRTWRTQGMGQSEQQADPILTAWSYVRERYDIDPQLVDNVLDGIEMDIAKHRYSTLDELLQYCYRVASSGALLAVPILRLKPGYTLEKTKPLVEKLGIAVQLTDILCDVGEDLNKGRIYLPEETLASFDLTYHDIENRVYDERFKRMMQHLIQVARNFFREGWPVLNAFPAAERLAAGFGAEMHWAALDKIEQVEYDVYPKPIKFSTLEKLRLFVSYLPDYLSMNERPT